MSITMIGHAKCRNFLSNYLNVKNKNLMKYSSDRVAGVEHCSQEGAVCEPTASCSPSWWSASPANSSVWSSQTCRQVRIEINLSECLPLWQLNRDVLLLVDSTTVWQELSAISFSLQANTAGAVTVLDIDQEQ